MIDEGDIPSIQYKLSLRGPKSTRKVDGPSLIFIDFYVPALIPRLSSTETSMQFWLSHVCRCHQGRNLDRHQVFGAYLLYILYNVGGRTESYGTPDCIFLSVGISPSTETLNFLWERKEPISLIRLIENFNSNNLYSKPRCHVISKDFFSLTKTITAVDMLLLKFKVTWFVSLIHWSIVLWRARKPKWLELSRPLSLKAPLSYFQNDFLMLVGPRYIYQVKIKVTLRLMVCQSVSLGVEPHLGLMTRYLLLFDSYELVLYIYIYIYGLGTDRIGDTSPNSSCIVAWVSVGANTWRILNHCPFTLVITESLPPLVRWNKILIYFIDDCQHRFTRIIRLGSWWEGGDLEESSYYLLESIFPKLTWTSQGTQGARNMTVTNIRHSRNASILRGLHCYTNLLGEKSLQVC
jgi:hypothetical protein